MKKTPYKSFTYKGEKYRAVVNDGCEGCAFFHNIQDCGSQPSWCSDYYRPDRKNVIWVKVKKRAITN